MMDLSDLKDDKEIQEKLNNLHASIDNIDRILEIAYGAIVPEELHVKDKLNYDLFIAYTLNTLYWMYLRTKGINPNETDIKKELVRVREYMLNAKSAVERHTHRSTIDKSAAERFIKHGIGHSNKEGNDEQPEKSDEPDIKKKKTA